MDTHYCKYGFYSTRRFVLCLTLCYLFSLFSIAITSLEEERANLSAFLTFVRCVLVLFCQFPLLLGVWEGLRFVIVALPGLFSYPFLSKNNNRMTQSVNSDEPSRMDLICMQSYLNWSKGMKWLS